MVSDHTRSSPGSNTSRTSSSRRRCGASVITASPAAVPVSVPASMRSRRARSHSRRRATRSSRWVRTVTASPSVAWLSSLPEQDADAQVGAQELRGVEPGGVGAGAQDGLRRLPVHGPQREPGADLAAQALRHGLGVGPLGRQDQHVARGGAGLGDLGEQLADGLAVLGVLEVAVHLVDEDHGQRHPIAGPAGDVGGDLALGADVVGQVGHALVAGVHVLDRIDEHPDQGLDDGLADPGGVEVRDLPRTASSPCRPCRRT